MSLYCPRNWLNPNIKNRAGQWLDKCREADMEVETSTFCSQKAMGLQRGQRGCLRSGNINMNLSQKLR